MSVAGPVCQIPIPHQLTDPTALDETRNTVCPCRRRSPVDDDIQGRPMKHRITLLTQLFLVCMSTAGILATPAAAATYYVATTGSDANPGTLGAPWQTLR